MTSSEPTYQAQIDFDARVPMRDGTLLSADIYRPRTSGRFPVLLLRTPYLKNGDGALATGRYFAERGYVLVWQDVRGRGDSDGVFVPYRNEGRDGYDTIEWCAAQPWSDGNVGTLGGSYLGRVQWLAALEHPAHLRAMVVTVCPSDPFVEWPTGTNGLQHLCWLHMTSGRTMQNTDAVEWSRVYEHLPLETMDERTGRSLPQWREELQHERLDDYWRAICYQDKFDQIDLPILHISGWYDDEQIGTPLNFRGMVARGASPQARAGQRLLMGPWGHQITGVTSMGEVDFGPDALLNLAATQLRWFDHWLKGMPNGVGEEAPVRIFVMGANTWRAEPAWPIERAQTTRYYLRSGGRANSRYGDGALATEPPGAEPADSYCYDPARPFPFLTEPTSAQIGGADDYAAAQRRDDVLVYMTPPLARDTEVTGPIVVELYAASSAPDTDFMAMLLDVHPSGFVQRLCDGVVRARYRDGLAAPALIEPGRAYRYTIDCWNTAQLFKQGHRICLQISSSAFPKYDRNLNTGESLASGTRMAVAQQTIFHDAEHPSCLVLPIVPTPA
ncbi:MAG: CocE/NonD family hydrolase [Kouleothrix sp.]|jgi:putative CocE/NonD family hydrolase|nr:CocE/NonD family hydrolase [Kouleothrix sp.]